MVDDPLVGQQIVLPPPVDVDAEEQYQVSCVEHSWVYGNQLQYLIRWMGCDSLTCNPAKFVDELQAVREIHQCYPAKPRPLENTLRGPRVYWGNTVTVLEGMKAYG
jgi:hypothetical protein